MAGTLSGACRKHGPPVARVLSAPVGLPKGTKLGWQSLIQITGHDTYFSTKYKQENERNVVKFLLSERNGVSLVDMLVLARENARTTREIMPTEAFELINGLHHFARDHVEKGLHRAERNDILEQIVSRAQQIGGLLAGSMSRDEAYSFVRLGRSLERADMTTRIIDVDAQKLMPQLDVEGLSQRPVSRTTTFCG